MENKVCSFFGHRIMVIDEGLKKKVKEVVMYLIVNCNVRTFLFESRSDFNDLCYEVVSEIKDKYPEIKRIAYICKNMSNVSVSKFMQFEELYSLLYMKQKRACGFEEVKEFKGEHIDDISSHLVRNKTMINDSDYCVFYYKGNYIFEMIEVYFRMRVDFQKKQV